MKHNWGWGGGASSILAQVASRGLLDEMAFEWTLKENFSSQPAPPWLSGIWDLGLSVCRSLEALKGVDGVVENRLARPGHTGTVGCLAVTFVRSCLS